MVSTVTTDHSLLGFHLLMVSTRTAVPGSHPATVTLGQPPVRHQTMSCLRSTD